MKLSIISILLLCIFSLFGCTNTDIVLPVTESQIINQATDINYESYVNGDNNNEFLYVDENKFSATSKVVFDENNVFTVIG